MSESPAESAIAEAIAARPTSTGPGPSPVVDLAHGRPVSLDPGEESDE